MSNREVTMRQVTKEDYDFIHDLLYETWYKDNSKNETLNRAFAEVFLNHSLNRSSFGYIAEVNNEQVGFIMAGVVGEEPVLRQLQTDPYQALLPILEAKETERAEAIAYEKRESVINTEMLAEATLNFDAEICLFIVSPKARGMGVGHQLFQEVLDEFDRLEVEKYYLYTDDGCNVSFYDKRKMHRANTRAFNPEETLEESQFNLYFYQNILE